MKDLDKNKLSKLYKSNLRSNKSLADLGYGEKHTNNLEGLSIKNLRKLRVD